jgi:hypothetical protein
MEKLLSIFPMEYLKFKFKQKYISENKYFMINNCPVHENDKMELLEDELFQKHPYLPVFASNLGRIKYNGRILEQKILEDGYLYVNIPYEIEQLKMETWVENKKMQNGLNTTIIEDVVEYNEMETLKQENEKFDWHPKIQVGVSNFGNVKNLYQSKFYGKYFVIYDQKYVNIPIFVYRIIAETWLDNPDYNIYNAVHHISNNGYDNTIFNLLWVSKRQHDEIEGK